MYKLKITERPKKKIRFNLLCLFNKHKYEKELSELSHILYTCTRCKEEWDFMPIYDTSLRTTKIAIYKLFSVNQTPRSLIEHLISQGIAFNATLNSITSQSETNAELFSTSGYSIFYLGKNITGGIKEK